MQPLGALASRDLTELVRRRPVELDHDLHADGPALDRSPSAPRRRWIFVAAALGPA